MQVVEKHKLRRMLLTQWGADDVQTGITPPAKLQVLLQPHQVGVKFNGARLNLNQT